MLTAIGDRRCQNVRCRINDVSMRPCRSPAPPTMRKRPSTPGHGHGHGHTHGIPIYILYAKPGDRAHLRKRTKRVPANPVLCMCWALIVMYLRSQTRVQTDRHARSYRSDMPSVPMGMGRNSRLHTACPDPQSLPCSEHSIALLGRIFFHKFVLDLPGVQMKPHSRRARKYQNHV